MWPFWSRVTLRATFKMAECYVPRFANWRSWRDSAQSVGQVLVLAEANTTFGICLINIGPCVHFEAHFREFSTICYWRGACTDRFA